MVALGNGASGVYKPCYGTYHMVINFISAPDLASDMACPPYPQSIITKATHKAGKDSEGLSRSHELSVETDPMSLDCTLGTARII